MAADVAERLSRADWAAALQRAFKSFLADGCMGLAKEIAYSALLAFFPAVIALVGLLDLVGAYGALESFLRPVAPKAVTQLIQTFRSDTGGGGSVVALVLGLLGAVWAASGAMSTVVSAVNRACELVETRPWWKRRLVSILLVVSTGIVTAGVLVLVVLGGTLGRAIERRTTLGDGFLLVWNIARWPIAFGALLLLFALVYSIAPNTPQRRRRWITPGSLLGALSWLAVSGLLALYTAFSNSYSKTYGTLAGGIILLLWLNYSAWAILFGAELDSELDRRARTSS